MIGELLRGVTSRIVLGLFVAGFVTARQTGYCTPERGCCPTAKAETVEEEPIPEPAPKGPYTGVGASEESQSADGCLTQHCIYPFPPGSTGKTNCYLGNVSLFSCPPIEELDPNTLSGDPAYITPLPGSIVATQLRDPPDCTVQNGQLLCPPIWQMGSTGGVGNGAPMNPASKLTQADGSFGGIAFQSTVSSAQAWWHAATSGPGGSPVDSYIEVKHEDGSIAKFEHFTPTASGAYTDLWRLTELRDPYDNVTRFSYDPSSREARITKIEHPSGITEEWHYDEDIATRFPGWDTAPGDHSFVEVRYFDETQTPRQSLEGLHWAMVFEDDTSDITISRKHFLGRLVARYTAKDKFVEFDPVNDDHIDPTTEVDARTVTLHEYGTTGFSRRLTKKWNVRTTHQHFPYIAIPTTPATHPTGTDPVLVKRYEYDTHTPPRVDEEYSVLEGVSRRFEYNNTPFNIAGVTLDRVTSIDGAGNKVHRDYDSANGRIWVEEVQLVDDLTNRPRAKDPDFVALQTSMQAFFSASLPVEPFGMRTVYDFDTSCVCQKPRSITRYPLDASGQKITGHDRQWTFRYDSPRHQITEQTMPNPSTEAGASDSTSVYYQYTTNLSTPTASESVWAPELLAEVRYDLDKNNATDDIVIKYEYPTLRPRVHASRHGLVPVRIEKAYTSLTRQTGLAASATTTTTGLKWVTTIDNAVTSALSDGENGVLNGLLSLATSPDNSDMEVLSNHSTGQPLSIRTGAVQSSMTYDAFGNLKTSTSNAGAANPYPQLVNYERSPTGTLYKVSATVTYPNSPSVLHETLTSYDRWGHVAVVRRSNRDGTGSAPSREGGSTGTPRAWVEDQFLYDGGLLIATLQDRRPLDEARDKLSGRSADSLWLRTEYEYDSRGEITEITHPNGAVTDVKIDGYGIPYTSVTTAPTAGGASVQHARMFYNYHLEPVFSHQSSAQGDLWTYLERDADSGVVTEVTEPQVTTVPAGYAGSKGGLVRHFEYDSLGRVIERRATDPHLLPWMIPPTSPGSPGTTTTVSKSTYSYDELGRVIRSESTAYMPNTTVIAGHEYVSIATYDATHPLLLRESSTTGTPATQTVDYTYDAHGRLLTVTDPLQNRTTYAYQTGTNWIESVARLSKDGVDPALLAPPAAPTDRTDVTQYLRDSLGRVRTLQVRGTSSTPGDYLEHRFEYGTLGQTTKYIDPLDKEHRYLADALGRLVEHARLGSDVITTKARFDDYTGTDGESLIVREDGLGHLTKTYLDFLGRPVVTMLPGATMKPDGTVADRHQEYAFYAEYDNASRRTKLYDGEGGEIEFDYDGPGRLIQSELVSIYNDKSFFSAGADTPAGQSSISDFTVRDRFVRDSMGRALRTLTWGRNSSGAYVLNTFNDFLIDSFGRTHQESSSISEDQIQLTQIKSGFDNGSMFRNDLSYEDNLSGIAPFAAESMPLDLEFDADAVGRLGTLSWNRAPGTGSNSTLAEYSYLGGWQRSRKMTIEGVGATTTHAVNTLISFDELGRANRLEDKIAGTVLSSFDYVLDDAGNLLKEIYSKQDGSDGDRFQYDDHHRLEKAWLGANSDFLAKNDPNAALQGAETFVQKLTYGLDESNNRTAVTEEDSSGSGTTDNYTLSGSGASGSNRYATVGTAQYVYDKRGNLIFDGQLCYLYDYKNRLSEVMTVQTQSSTLSGGQPQSQTTTSTTNPLQRSQTRYVVYDEARLRRSLETVSDNCGMLDHLIECRDNPFFQERSSAPAGGAVQPATGQTHQGGLSGVLPIDIMSTSMVPLAFYTYDATNRRSLRYVFGASGIDIRVHVWDGWREVIESELRSYVPAGEQTAKLASVPVQQFVWGVGLDELVAYRDQDDYGSGLEVRDFWATQGGQDTTVRVLDEGANSLAAFEYDPYGMPSAASLTQMLNLPGHGTRFLWKGMRVDLETQNGYRRHRYYSFGVGRFLSTDPIGVWGDRHNAGNGFSYGANSPLVNRDPYGLQTVTTGEDLYGPAEAPLIDGEGDEGSRHFINIGLVVDGELVMRWAEVPQSECYQASDNKWYFNISCHEKFKDLWEGGRSSKPDGLYQPDPPGLLDRLRSSGLIEAIMIAANSHPIGSAIIEERYEDLAVLFAEEMVQELAGLGLLKVIGKAAGFTGKVGRALKKVCFTGETLVVTKRGLVTIDSVEIGDEVYAYDEEKGEVVTACVVHTTAEQAEILVDLTIEYSGSGRYYVLSGTPEHPVYVPALSSYIAMGALEVGAVLHTTDGIVARVVSSRVRCGKFEVFNFEVQGEHNYFVSPPMSAVAGILVHNDCYKKPKSGLSAKQASKDAPSWAMGNRPKVGESGKQFAKRLMDEKYGAGNYKRGPGSEFNKIQKWGDRAFE